MKRIILICMAMILVLFLCDSCKIKNNDNTPEEPSPEVEENVYYVSGTGIDSNSGSKESPWKSPGFASRQLKPGDTLIILGGEYVLGEYDADILMPSDGAPGQAITIKGEEDNRPVLKGENNLLCAISLSSYLIIENLEITSHNGALFRDAISQIDYAIKNVVLRGLYIHHIDEFGVNIADVWQLTIENCKIVYTGFGSVGGPEGQEGGWRQVVIDHCDLSYNGHYYQGKPVLGPYSRPDGFGIEPSSGPIEIRNTKAEHNRGDGLDSKAGNTYIHHCIVANNSCDGIKLWAGDSKIENCLIYGTGDGVGGASPWAGLVIDGNEEGDLFEIINVTLQDNPQRQAYPMYIGYDQIADIQVIMRNCIVANGYGVAYFGPRVQATIEYNLFYRPGQDIQLEANGKEYSIGDLNNGVPGKGNLVGDPFFVLSAWGKQGNYHLQSSSPAIDSGTTDGAPANDLEGNPRPSGEGIDLGAYEEQN
jgi:hypothetical protein